MSDVFFESASKNSVSVILFAEVLEIFIGPLLIVLDVEVFELFIESPLIVLDVEVLELFIEFPLLIFGLLADLDVFIALVRFVDVELVDLDVFIELPLLMFLVFGLQPLKFLVRVIDAGLGLLW